MCKRGGWDVRGEKRKKSIEALEDGKERHLSVNTKGGGGKGKPVGIADFTVLPLLKGNNAWLSNQSQALCRKSSHMRGAMTPSSLQSHSFLHAFLFWGVFMNDLKSDPFLSPDCLEGSRLGEGGVWGGKADPDAKVSRLRRDRNQIAAPVITHQTWIAWMFQLWDQVRSVLFSWNRIVSDRGWRTHDASGGRCANWRIIFTEHHTSHHSSQNLTPQVVPWN